MNLQIFLKNLPLVFILLNTSGQILAKNRIEVSGEKVTFDTAHNTGTAQGHTSDLKVGQFTRVKSPLIDLIQTAESSLNDKEASDRVKAAQAMGLAAQGYSLANSNGANLFRVESGTGLSHSRQRQASEYAESLGNHVNAQHIDIQARSGKLSATQTAFTTKDDTGKRQAGSSITLSGAEGVELQAGESYTRQKGKSQSYGTEVGTALSAGAQTGWSFYGREGFSKGEQGMESKTYHHSQLDSETLTINSGKDAVLKGATAKAKSIHTNIQGTLRVESVQDEQRQYSQGIGIGTEAEFGFGTAWSAKGSANLAEGEGYRKQVREQSGLFAEEGGYHINANNVELIGGAITSTRPEESTLRTNAVVFSDIQNHSHYSTTAGGISGVHNQDSTTGIPALPTHRQDNDSSLTRATLTEGTIILNRDSQPTVSTAAALGINTELSQRHRETTHYDLAEKQKSQAEVEKIAKAGAYAVGTLSQAQGWQDGSIEKRCYTEQ